MLGRQGAHAGVATDVCGANLNTMPLQLGRRFGPGSCKWRLHCAKPAGRPQPCLQQLLLGLVMVLVLSLGVSVRPCHGFDDVPMPQRRGGELETRIRFFLHDDLLTTDRPPTAVTVVPPVAGFNGTLEGQSFFGAIVVFDDPITAGPERATSPELGRGRGTYVFTAMNNSAPGIEFVWTAVFNDASGFGGSTLSYQGFDSVLAPVREISVTGGTGKFRFAKGYAVITTYRREGAAVILDITTVVRYPDE